MYEFENCLVQAPGDEVDCLLKVNWREGLLKSKIHDKVRSFSVDCNIVRKKSVDSCVVPICICLSENISVRELFPPQMMSIRPVPLKQLDGRLFLGDITRLFKNDLNARLRIFVKFYVSFLDSIDNNELITDNELVSASEAAILFVYNGSDICLVETMMKQVIKDLTGSDNMTIRNRPVVIVWCDFISLTSWAARLICQENKMNAISEMMKSGLFADGDAKKFLTLSSTPQSIANFARYFDNQNSGNNNTNNNNCEVPFPCITADSNISLNNNEIINSSSSSNNNNLAHECCGKPISVSNHASNYYEKGEPLLLRGETDVSPTPPALKSGAFLLPVTPSSPSMFLEPQIPPEKGEHQLFFNYGNISNLNSSNLSASENYEDEIPFKRPKV